MNIRTHIKRNWSNPLLAALIGIGLSPAASQAGFFVTYGFDNALAQQSVGFSPPPPNGLSVTGNTNPAPIYDVTATSLEGVTLSANGSHVGNAAGGPTSGITAISFTPEAGYQWTYFDMQLDSVQNDVPLDTPGLTFKLYRDGFLVLTQALNFPHEGNLGENQHYYAYTTGADSFDRIDILYTPSGDFADNLIHEIHNIDVASVPLPSTLVMSSICFGMLAIGAMRKRLKESMAAA